MLCKMEDVLLCHGHVNVNLLNKEPSISKKIRKRTILTKLILHTLDATANGSTTLEIHLPDTDFFVLSLRRYPEVS